MKVPHSEYKSNAKDTKTPFIAKAVIQKKLDVGAVNDPFEVEADSVADKVLNMDTIEPKKNFGVHKVHKKALGGSTASLVQMKTGRNIQSMQASKALTKQINGSRGSGQKMDTDTKGYMEDRFRVDFSDVNIHTGSDAIKMSSDLNAQAFTVGNDIYFNEGKYNPISYSGKHLLAHELTHTIQQMGSVQLKIQREMIRDRNEDFYFDTQEDAQDRVGRLVRIVPDPEHEGRFLIEWRWDTNDPERYPWQRGTVSRSQSDTERRMGQLIRVEGEGNRWYLMKDDSLMPSEGATTPSQTPQPNTTPSQSSTTPRPQSTGSGPTPVRVGGDTNSNKIIRIAWTFDDGPTQHTSAMQGAFTNAIASTWYIQYHHLEPNNASVYRSKIGELLNIQTQGGEIAMHGLSPNSNMSHAFWFPRSTGNHFPSIQDAMQALRTFHTALTNEGINVRFVRLPGGLVSELSSYLLHLGVTNSNRIARDIISGNNVAIERAQQVIRDYHYMLQEVRDLGLHLWGGSADPARVQSQSWEAETSGVSARHDYTTRHVHTSRQGNEPNAGVFEDLVDTLTSSRPRSLVILAHDTSSSDVGEVGEDDRVMNAYALQHNARIEYYTMSDLFQVVTGTNPGTNPTTSP